MVQPLFAVFFFLSLSFTSVTATCSSNLASSNTQTIEKLEDDLYFCIGCLHFSPTLAGLRDIFEERLLRLEASTKVVHSNFKRNIALEKRHIFGAIVGRALYSAFTCGNTAFPNFFRLGLWMHESLSIPLDSLAGSSEILNVQWSSYPLPAVLDLMHILRDVRLTLARHVLKFKLSGFADLLNQSLYSENVKDYFNMWNSSFASILRHSALEDLENLQELMIKYYGNNDKKLSYDRHFQRIFERYPYLTIAKLIPWSIVESYSSTLREIFELAKTGYLPEDFTEYKQNTHERKFIQYAIIDSARSWDSGYRGETIFFNDIFEKCNMHSKSIVSLLDQSIPSTFSYVFISRNLRSFAGIFRKYPFVNPLMSLVLQRIHSSLEALKIFDLDLYFSITDVADFALASLHTSITPAQANLPLEVLGDLYGFLFLEGKVKLLEILQTKIEPHHLSLLGQMISTSFLRGPFTNEDLPTIRSSIVREFFIMLLGSRIVSFTKDQHGIICQQWEGLLRKQQYGLGDKIFDQVYGNLWQLARVQGIDRVFKAINQPEQSIKLVHTLLNDLPSINPYEMFRLAMNLLDHLDIRGNLSIFSDLFWFTAINSETLSLKADAEGRNWRQEVLDVANRHLTEIDDSVCSFHLNRIMSVAENLPELSQFVNGRKFDLQLDQDVRRQLDIGIFDAWKELVR